jgi:uncharacterized protein related to proFAR isomerase
MKIIPLIHLKKRRIIEEKLSGNSNFKDLLESAKEDQLYVLDYDGIDKNKPNLCIYQKLSKNHKIWVDSGSRILGDIVDTVIAGAIAITIRNNFWHDIDTLRIKEVTENKIYSTLNFNKNIYKNVSPSYIQGVDGIVIFDIKNNIERDFKYSGFIKDICNTYETYAYEINEKNANYWMKLGVTGLLVDIEHLKEFKR